MNPKEALIQDIDDAVDIMLVEQECVIRNDNGNCDRQCQNCDLLRDTEKILHAYTMALASLKMIKKTLGGEE